MIIILRFLAEASKNCPIEDFHAGACQTSTGQEGEEVSSQEKLTDRVSKQSTAKETGEQKPRCYTGSSRLEGTPLKLLFKVMETILKGIDTLVKEQDQRPGTCRISIQK